MCFLLSMKKSFVLCVHSTLSLYRNSNLERDFSFPKFFPITWAIIVDSNKIIAWKEKLGGLPFYTQENNPLIQLMMSNEAIDIGSFSSRFTWCNNRFHSYRIAQRLDRVLITTLIYFIHMVYLKLLDTDRFVLWPYGTEIKLALMS